MQVPSYFLVLKILDEFNTYGNVVLLNSLFSWHLHNIIQYLSEASSLLGCFSVSCWHASQVGPYLLELRTYIWNNYIIIYIYITIYKILYVIIKFIYYNSMLLHYYYYTLYVIIAMHYYYMHSEKADQIANIW